MACLQLSARSGKRGFSLIEAMIVVAILAVMAAVAGKRYLEHSLRAKTAEVQTIMGGIRVSQNAFMVEFEEYAHIYQREPWWAPHSDKRPWRNNPCPTTCTRSNTWQCFTFSCIGFRPATPTYFDYASLKRNSTATLPPEMCIEARADLDSDGRVGNFEYQTDNNQDGAGTNARCDFNNQGPCAPNSLFAGAINDCNPGQF